MMRSAVVPTFALITAFAGGPLIVACSPAPSPPPQPTATASAAPTSSADAPPPRKPSSEGAQPIPDGFDFPADGKSLVALRDKADPASVAKLREHVWHVWAGLNQATPGGGPVWETWYTKAEVFRAGAAPQGASTKRVRAFEKPRQLDPHGASPQGAGQSLLSFVLLSEEARAHIRANKLHVASELDQRRAKGEADVPPFPARASIMKTVWWPVKRATGSALPMWDGDPSPASTQPKPISSWKRAVWLLPKTAPKIDHGPNGEDVVSLDRLYHVTIGPDAIASARAILGADVDVGDEAAFVGAHLTTKEIDDWVWATFWWHDKPDDGAFGANKTADIPSPFRNYRMSESFSMTQPLAADGGPHVAFNPWLETSFPSGTVSNCMSCHRRAAWPRLSFLPVIRGAIPASDASQRDHTRLDFLWSITDEAQ
jgi:hypothetical protein